jgi:hypothetical protein
MKNIALSVLAVLTAASLLFVCLELYKATKKRVTTEVGTGYDSEPTPCAGDLVQVCDCEKEVLSLVRETLSMPKQGMWTFRRHGLCGANGCIPIELDGDPNQVVLVCGAPALAAPDGGPPPMNYDAVELMLGRAKDLVGTHRKAAFQARQAKAEKDAAEASRAALDGGARDVGKKKPSGTH